MTREEIEALWKDSRHWKWWVYYCKADPRAIVPKRLKWMGWTVNFARPSAMPVLLILLVILAGPIFILSTLGAANDLVLITGAASLAVVCSICAKLSSRTE